MRKRSTVIEHRITFNHGGLTVRMWVESSPAHGGTGRSAALTEALAVCSSIPKQAMDTTDWESIYFLAERILAQVAAANSVEVCNYTGNGVAIHKDWP